MFETTPHRALLFATLALAGAAWRAAPAHAEEPLPCPCDYEVYGVDGTHSLVHEPFGAPAIGHTFELLGRGAMAGSPALLLMSTNRAEIDMSGVTLLVDPTALIVSAMVTADANGLAEFPFPVPNVPAYVGFRAHAQWVGTDADGAFAMSDGLTINIMDVAHVLRTDRAIDANLNLTLANGSTVAAPIDGEVSFELEDGAVVGTESMTITSLSFHADDVTLPDGSHTGALELATIGPTTTTVTPTTQFTYAGTLAMTLTYSALTQSSEHTIPPSLDLGALPAPIGVDVAVLLARESDGSLSLALGGINALPATAPLLGQATFDTSGDVLPPENETCYAIKVPKLEACLRIHVVRDGAGQNAPVTTDTIVTQLAQATQIWCDQCCIGFKVDAAIDFIDSDLFQSIPAYTFNPPLCLSSAVGAITQGLLCEQVQTPGCIDIFYIQEFTSPPQCPQRFGLTLSRPQGCGACVIMTANADGLVLAHELGHAMGFFTHYPAGVDQLMAEGSTSTKVEAFACVVARRFCGMTETGEKCEPHPQQ